MRNKDFVCRQYGVGESRGVESWIKRGGAGRGVESWIKRGGAGRGVESWLKRGGAGRGKAMMAKRGGADSSPGFFPFLSRLFPIPLPAFLEIGHPLCPHQTKAKYTDIRIQISCDVYYCCAKFLSRTVFPCV